MRQALLHSAFMASRKCFHLFAAAAACLCLLTVQPACAASNVSMKVDVGEKVIFCEALLKTDTARLTQVLKDGTEVGIDWEISIERVRTFWLNSGIAAVHVRRRVVPDLVSQSWRLLDISTGITQRVTDVHAAVRFLTHLEHFPVLDRSLLEAAMSYVMYARLEERQGPEDKGWFSTWWGYESSGAEARFSLP